MENIKIALTENGTTTLATAGKYCDRNVDVEVNVAGGGGGDIEVEPIVLSSTQDYACSGPVSGAYIELHGDSITTQDLLSHHHMFYQSTVKKIPFDINAEIGTSYQSGTSIFNEAAYLEEAPNINNAYYSSIDSFFNSCDRLRSIPEDFGENWNWDRLHTYNYANMSSIFMSCRSLRRIPENFLKNLYGVHISATYNCYNKAFCGCSVLDEIKSLGVNKASAVTANFFSATVDNCWRLKDFTFNVNEDGSAKTANWKNQTLDFSRNVGDYNTGDPNQITTDYNSGITADKQVIDDASYQALKNDPDWFTTNRAYSRYNHDSAVNTINSLPDTSAYLATAGGTNTIKFTGAAGSATDGGAINTLTEEEIAVATAKGWTVTLS